MKIHIYSLIILSLFLSCKEAEKVDDSTKNDGLMTVTKQQFQSANMQIEVPSEQSFDVVVKCSGKIDVPPQNRAQITSFMGGYVKETHLLVGDKVRKGQALLTLQNTQFLDIQKDYLEVAEQIRYLKSEYFRQKTLFDEKISSEKNYLKAESDYRKTNAIYQSLREKLILLNINPTQVEKGNLTSVITIYSPIAGDIVIMNANVGMPIGTSDVILEIVDTQHLHLELSVFEKDILKIKVGQKIKFTVPEATSEFFNAEVHLVGKSIEGNDRTINVHGHLDDAIKQKLLTGMFVEASIIVNSKKGLAVPSDALITESDKNFVLLLVRSDNDYSFKKVKVSVGERSEKFVEIIANEEINSASKIMTRGVFDVIE